MPLASSKQNFINTILYCKAGVSHTERSIGCQDSTAKYQCRETGIKAVALSDGAGSCSNSAAGSQLIASQAAEFLVENFDYLYSADEEASKDFVLKHLQRSLAEMAKAAGITDFMSLSATLAATALAPDGRYVLYHIGDGAIVGFNPSKGTKVLSVYNHNGPVNQTCFVTETAPEIKLTRGCGAYSSFLVMSDGAENFLIHRDTVHAYAALLQQLSYNLGEETVLPAFDNLFSILTESGMADDCSFAIITDTRELGEMYLYAFPETLEIVFGESPEFVKKKNDSYTRRFSKLLTTLAALPDGADYKSLCGIMNKRRKDQLQKQLEPYIDIGLFETVPGGIRLVPLPENSDNIETNREGCSEG